MDILKMGPRYRYGEATPWGGDNLRLLFGKNAPEDRVGESLEVSALSGLESLILNGDMAGQTLADALEKDYEGVTGTDKKPFPLLLKLLDARDTLSVQVHPGDEYALAHEGRPGKNEAWLILYAEPGAKIVYGLDTDGEPLSKIMEEGRLEECLHWETVRPGDVYYIPSGTVHAIGEGILCYEIQQSSDVAYRLYDWGRVDENGNAPYFDIQQPWIITTETADDYQKYWLEEFPIPLEAMQNLLYRYNPDVSYDDFKEVLENYGYDWVMSFHK